MLLGCVIYDIRNYFVISGVDVSTETCPCKKVIMLQIWKPCALNIHVPKLVMSISMCTVRIHPLLSNGNYMCATGYFFLLGFFYIHNDYYKINNNTDAIAHVRSTTYVGGDFHRLSSDSTPCPIMHRGRLSHDTPANRVMRARLPSFDQCDSSTV